MQEKKRKYVAGRLNEKILESGCNIYETAYAQEFVASKGDRIYAIKKAREIAGKPPAKNDKTARLMSYQVGEKECVKLYIEKLHQEVLGPSRQRALDVVRELGMIGSSSIFDVTKITPKGLTVHDEKFMGEYARAIKSINVDETGRVISIQLHDKVKSLELLGKHQQLFVDRVDHTTGGQPLGPMMYLPERKPRE